MAKAIALTETLNSTVEDHALAEDLAKAVLARQPTDPETVIVNAYVENRFILRGFDLSEERYATARRLCERALLLAPDHPEALHVLGQFLVFRQADLPRAVDLLRRAVTLQPGQARFYNSYIEALGAIKAPETVQVAEAAAARFPDDPIIHYRLALTYAFEAGRLDAYEKALKETIAIGPVATALIRLSTIMMIVHHDIPAARAWLDRVPAAFRLNDRTVFARYMLASASGEPADVENALRLLSALPGNFLNDFGLLPKQMLIGDLYARVGNEVVARCGYEAALVDIAQEQARNPQLKFERVRKLILLGLGRKAEARETVNLTYATAARPFTLVGVSNTWFNTITTLLLLDERAKAVELLREAVKEEWGRRILAGTFAVDPHLAPWREDAEIQALLADPAATPSAMPAVDQKSVAVLAFANLSDDKANEYFSDGISEELLNVLAKVPGLKVSARTSAFFFKGKEVPIPEIARQLGVAYVVEGSVRKQGDKVRITAQLIKAADGFHVWSDTFTRDLKDIFAVQDEIAGLVARNLEAKLGAATRPEARVDARVLELYMQGRVAWNRRNTEGFDRAEALFREALAIAPDFARAHAALGDVWMIRAISDGNLSLYGQRSASVIPPIEAEVQRALELDPESAEAHATLGFLRQLQHRPDEALRLLRRSVELNPNYATGHHWLAGILAYGSWFEESIAEYRRAVAVDPLSPRILDNFGGTLLSLGRLHEALTFFDRALILQPDEPQALAHRAIALARLGRRDEARALAGKISKGNRLSFLLATGDRAELETALTGATRSERFYLLSALGRPDEALNYFSSDDIVLEDTQDWLFDHNLVPFYHDPRFRKVITELGFDDYLTRALAWQAANPAAKK